MGLSGARRESRMKKEVKRREKKKNGKDGWSQRKELSGRPSENESMAALQGGL